MPPRRDRPAKQTSLFGKGFGESVPAPGSADAPPPSAPTVTIEEAGPSVVSVAEITRRVSDAIGATPLLRGVWVKGEISNFKSYGGSGHWYFTLKDEKEEGQIAAVCFRRENARIPFEPSDGLSVLAYGSVRVYGARGNYQLYVQDIKPDGAGALALAFEQLKKRLAAEGLFDESRKVPIPSIPARIGVVTSLSGAAVRDIITVVTRRWPAARIVLRGVRVQGDGSGSEIAAAIRSFNAHDAADVLIVGRGGGSIEDLWAFNEEVVVRAIAESHIPIVSAVGHETDFTLADFAADERAPTPSAAAERVVPDAREFVTYLREVQVRLARGLTDRVVLARERVTRLSSAIALASPERLLAERRQRLDDAGERMGNAARTQAERARGRLERAAALLDSLSPLSTLARGYAVAFKTDGSVVRAREDVETGESLRLRVERGEVRVTVAAPIQENESS